MLHVQMYVGMGDWPQTRLSPSARKFKREKVKEGESLEDLDQKICAYNEIIIAQPYKIIIGIKVSIINHTLPSTIRAVMGTLTCTGMASNGTSNSECY